MRFSLRGLFVGITLFAIVLSSWLGYRRATLCQLQWLSPASAAAKSLAPSPTIEKLKEGSYQFKYYARSRDIQSLIRRPKPDGSYHVQVEQQSVVVKSPDLNLARSYLQTLQAADIARPGAFVIRGRVVDRSGRPITHATIDLMGDFVFINHFETRDDGTFTMPLDDPGGLSAPAGSGYYLRVRSEKDSAEKPTRWESPSFPLSPTSPECDVLVVIPQTLEIKKE